MTDFFNYILYSGRYFAWNVRRTGDPSYLLFAVGRTFQLRERLFSYGNVEEKLMKLNSSRLVGSKFTSVAPIIDATRVESVS